VDGFVRSSARGLYVAGSADGCLVGGGERCSNGWTAQDVYHMATGAGPSVYAVPQIYRTDGIQARQWAGISRIAQAAGNPPVRFAAAMTQQMACKQKPPCPNTDNPPDRARSQLSDALADPALLDGSKNVKGVTKPDDSDKSQDSGSFTDPNGSTGPGASHSGTFTDPNGSTGPGASPAPGGGTVAGTNPVLDASKSSGAFGSTDVAWPDDQSALAWVTAQPSVPGGPTG
jgi:hypothetical protein